MSYGKRKLQNDGVVLLLDAEGNFKYISPSAKKMFGYQLNDKLNKNPAEYTHPDDLPLVLSELGKILEDPDYIPTLEYRFIDKQSNWHWVETTFSNLLANPRVESIVLNFRDITGRKNPCRFFINAFVKIGRVKLSALRIQAHCLVAQANAQPKPAKELACPVTRIDRRESTKR